RPAHGPREPLPRLVGRGLTRKSQRLREGTHPAGPSCALCVKGSQLLFRAAGDLYNRTMLHLVLPVGPLQCNCSIIAAEQSREAIVIDPGDEIEGILALIREHKLTVRQIVITHAHIDHVGGAMKLKQATAAPILLNQNDLALLRMLDVQAAWVGMRSPGKVEIDASLAEGDAIRAGSIVGTVMHTPGHTEGSICRTDLPGGSLPAILRSLHTRVLALPDETGVIPGHGPATTIGKERATNPFLTGKIAGQYARE